MLPLKLSGGWLRLRKTLVYALLPVLVLGGLPVSCCCASSGQMCACIPADAGINSAQTPIAKRSKAGCPHCRPKPSVSPSRNIKAAVTNAQIPINAGPCRHGHCQCAARPTQDVPKQAGIALESVHHAPASDLPAIGQVTRATTPLELVGRLAIGDDLSRQSDRVIALRRLVI